MRYRLQIVTVLVALLVCLSPASGAGTAPAVEDIKGQIAGKVADDAGKPVKGAVVEAFACSDGTLAGSAKAGDNGDYLLGPIADGCYHVRFDGEGYESTWHGEPGIRDAAFDVEVSGQKTGGIEGALTAAGALIAGTVKGADGKPLPGAWVTAMRQDETGFSMSDGQTDAKGGYTVRVSPGQYVVVFSRQGHVTKVYGSADKPTLVDAREGKTVGGIDAALAKGGKISGKVTDVEGNGLSGIYVFAYGAGQAFGINARTDRSGRYTLDGVPTGSFRIAFMDRNEKYVPSWYGGGSDPGEAAQVAVTAPAGIAGIDGQLKRAGGISGKITGPDGNPVIGAVVMAGSADHAASGGSAVTNETGEYTIGGLPSGTYTVAVNSGTGSTLPVYYRDATGEKTALPVEVAAPQITYGINQVLQGPSLTGAVRNAAGEPVAGAMVFVYQPGKDSEMLGVVSTDAAGAFSISLPDGKYVMRFSAVSGGYLAQWSGGRTTREEAVPVTVSRKEGAQKLEIVLIPGGTISGTVRNGTGVPIAKVSVSARDAVTGESLESATTDEQGKYIIQGLQAGPARLVAEGTQAGYIRQKVQNVVEVGLSAATENVDIVMIPGGSVSGTVVDGAGNPVAGVSVTAHDSVNWDDVASSYTDGGGAYSIGGLPEGTYRIRFEGDTSRYAAQWYRGKPRREESSPVEVLGTKNIPGIDATLAAGVPLTGMVTAAGVPLHDAIVEVYGRTEDEPFDKVHTDRNGKFTVPSLAVGSYRIRFSHNDYIPQWYGGRDRRTALPVSVESGIGPLSVSLVKGESRFSGKLTNPEGQKIGQAWITALDAATGMAIADERICECSGRFNTPVPAGSYLLRVERHGFVTWFGGNNREEAVPVPLYGDVGGLDMVIEDEHVRAGRGPVKPAKGK